MKNFFALKRIVSAVLVLVVVLGVSFGPVSKDLPSIAHAQFTTFETNPAIIAGITTTAAATGVTAAATGAQAAGVSPKDILSALAWTVAKMTIQSITRSTVNWINTGFQGSPAFVTDLQSNLRNLGDAIADNFLTNLNRTVVDTTGFNIKTPFQDQLNQQLRQEYYRTTSSWGLDYTLYQQSEDPGAFTGGDFSKGGVSAFLSASQNPANNPFGAYLLASNQLWSQVDAAAQQRKAELNWGQGFLSWRGKCATTPAARAAGTSLSTAEKCPFNSIKTLGSTVEQLFGITATSPIRQLELADSINEIVGALMGQLVNQVLGGGGVTGLSQPSAGGGSSFVDRATDPSQYNGVSTSLAGGVVQSIVNDKSTVTTYRDNWQKVLDAATTAQKACGVRPDITTAITKATAGVAKGNLGLTKVSAIQTEIQNASQSTAANTSTVVVTALADYQSYLSSSDIPSAAEGADAAFQSSDTSVNTTTSTALGTTPTATPGTQSLYTQMTTAAKSCTAGKTS